MFPPDVVVRSTTQENHAAFPQRPGEAPTCSYCEKHTSSVTRAEVEEVQASALRLPTSAPCSHDSLVVLLPPHRAAAGPRPADEDQDQTQVRLRRSSRRDDSTLASLALHRLPSLTCRSYSSTSFEDAVKKAEEPPTPPPRPQKSHSRASSLDLNKLFQQGAAGVCVFVCSCSCEVVLQHFSFRSSRAEKRGNAD